MRRTSAFTQAEMTAAFKAARNTGVRVALEVRPDGTRRIETFPMSLGEMPAITDINDAIEKANW